MDTWYPGYRILNAVYRTLNAGYMLVYAGYMRSRI